MELSLFLSVSLPVWRNFVILFQPPSDSSRTDIFSPKKVAIFHYFSMKAFVVGAHLKRLIETLQMSTTTNVFLES